MTQREAYDEICAYTLTLGDAAFIHQHVVDAFTAQTADDTTRPIAVAFALVGLYLHVERHLTGREVQQAHKRLARHKCAWPSFTLPRDRGSVTAADVLGREAGRMRDDAIHSWCAAVWDVFRASQPSVEELLLRYPEALYRATRTT